MTGIDVKRTFNPFIIAIQSPNSLLRLAIASKCRVSLRTNRFSSAFFAVIEYVGHAVLRPLRTEAMASIEDHAAVNDERLTSHVIGVRTGEVGDARGHVFRF